MSHTIRPKIVLNGRQKPCWPFRADFTPCGVLGVSRPDPNGGRPRVKPVSLHSSPLSVIVNGRLHVVLPVVVTCRDVGSSEVAARKLRRPLAVLPTRGVGALRVAWPRTSFDAPICECRDATRDVAIFLVVARATRVTRLWRVTTWVGCGDGFRWCLHVWWMVVVAFRVTGDCFSSVVVRLSPHPRIVPLSPDGLLWCPMAGCSWWGSRLGSGDVVASG